MVKRNTVLIILHGSVDAGHVSERLLHHWLRAGTSSKVRVPANRGKIGSTRSKVMVRNRVERRGTVTAHRSSHLIVGVTIHGARVEGRCTRQGTMLAGETDVIVSTRLPVDGLHATFEIGGGPELPLANDGPHDDCGSNRSSNDDENRHSRMRHASGGRG